jgi:hypothetical protein
MSTEPEHTEVDALLARLPQWTPPPDFAARLAAAAARQADMAAPVPLSTWAWLLRRLARRESLIIGSALLALGLAVIPWAVITTNPLFPWLFAASSAALGGRMTLRLLWR